MNDEGSSGRQARAAPLAQEALGLWLLVAAALAAEMSPCAALLGGEPLLCPRGCFGVLSLTAKLQTTAGQVLPSGVGSQDGSCEGV